MYTVSLAILHLPIRHCIITTTPASIKHNAIPLCQSIEQNAEQQTEIYTRQQMLTQLKWNIPYFIIYISNKHLSADITLSNIGRFCI